MLEIILAFSTHFLPGEWNETHPGIRYEQASFMGAFFMNSEGNPSLAIGLIQEVDVTDSFNLFAEAGLVAGYSGADVLPFVRFGAEYKESVSVFVQPAMTVDGDVGAVLGVGYVLARF